MSQYLITAKAMQDLNEIASYLGDVSLESADRFLQEFDRRCIQLVSFPRSGKGYNLLIADRATANLNSQLLTH